MPKRWTDLENVRLAYDASSNTVRLTSKDARLNGESFVMQLSRNTRAEELARIVLHDSGVDLPLTDEPPATHNPRYRSNDPYVIPIGDQGDGEDVFVDLRYSGVLDGTFPPTIAIVGKPGSGKTVLANSMLAHFKRFPSAFDVFVCTSSGQESEYRGVVLNPEDLPYIQSARTGKRRVFIIDSTLTTWNHPIPSANEAEHQQYRQHLHIMDVLRGARSRGDIVVFTSFDIYPTVNMASYVIAMGRHDLRERIALGIDDFGVIRSGEGVLSYWYESSDPAERSGESFTAYQPG